jgi:hypothetical protein
LPPFGRREPHTRIQPRLAGERETTEDSRERDVRLEGVRLEVLLKAYELERADDANTPSVIIALLTTSVGLLSLVGFALVNSSSIKPWIIAVLPLVPFPFIAFGAIFAHLVVFRGHYIDALERELHRRTDNWRVEDVAIPSGHHLMGRAWWSRRVNVGIWLMFIALAVLYGGIVWESFNLSFSGTHHGHHRDRLAAVLSVVGVGISTSIVFGLYLAINSPTAYFRRLARVAFEDKREENKLQPFFRIVEFGLETVRAKRRQGRNTRGEL